jgi:ribonuclease-3
MARSDDLLEWQDTLGYRFRDPALLERALTHSSYWNERGAAEGLAGDNEVLELIGDSVLGLVVAESLWRRFPGWPVGKISQARSRIVSARYLHAAATRLNLGRLLLLGRGQEKTGLRGQRDVLADAYEATIAAIYLDAGLPEAAAFVERTLMGEALGEDPEALGEPDDKWALMDFLRARGKAPPEFRLVSECGPDHRKMFLMEVAVEGRVLASAQAGSKKEAEQTAARIALTQLREELG